MGQWRRHCARIPVRAWRELLRGIPLEWPSLAERAISAGIAQRTCRSVDRPLRQA